MQSLTISRDGHWSIHGYTVGCEIVEYHLSRKGRKRLASVRGIALTVGSYNRLRTCREVGLFDQSHVPLGDEAMVAVDLEVIVFASPELHYFSPCPAHAFTVMPVYVENIDSPIISYRTHHLFGTVLPADADMEVIGMSSFCQAIFNCRNQFRIAIRCNGDKDRQVVFSNGVSKLGSVLH